MRNGYLALVIFCCCAICVIGFVSVTYVFSKGYQSAVQDHAADYATQDQAEISYRKCLETATSLEGARECVNNTKHETRESKRSEKELNAQREMADWAEGMLWTTLALGVLSLGVTIVGVRYVYLTLVATQAMAKDATRASDAAVAQVNASKRPRLRVRFERVKGEFAVLSVENFGEAAAQIKASDFVVRIDKSRPIPRPWSVDKSTDHTPNELPSKEITTDYAGGFASWTAKIPEEAAIDDVVMMGGIVYTKAGDDRTYRTFFCREYDASRMRFFPIKDDQEYERED